MLFVLTSSSYSKVYEKQSYYRNIAKGKQLTNTSVLLIDESTTLSHKSALLVYLLCIRDVHGNGISPCSERTNQPTNTLDHNTSWRR